MKTLVIYSGQTRAFQHVWANHVWNVHRKLPDPTFIVSVADDEQADDMLALKGALPDKPFFMEKVVQPEIEVPPVRCRWHAGHGIRTTPQAVLKQLWALNRAWDFAWESVNIGDYDLFVRIRCDSTFFRCLMPWDTFSMENKWPENLGGALRAMCHMQYEAPLPDVAWTPRWARWGGVNDRFALMGHAAAHAYFTTFAARETLWKEWCPLHPETMIAYQLERTGCHPTHDLKCEFGKVRMDGTVEACEWTPIDIADAR